MNKETNPVAYDELKKKLLQEYKKLTTKAEENRTGGNLNVYKPTFIINNSFQNDAKKQKK